MRALFYGTPDIAVPALEALTDIADVVGVVCQPDRPAGRGMKLKAPPVKARAAQLGLEIQQPTRIKTGAFPDWVASKRADVALVIAYGRILPARLLEAPRRGCMNLHASLLPKYRGAAPINWAIVHGESDTGISLMQMDEGCDTGPVFSRHAIAIGPNETAGELYLRLASLAADTVRRDLKRAVDGDLLAAPQAHDGATHAPMLSKRDGLINWQRSAQQVHDHARGMTPWPGAFSFIDGKRIKVLETRMDSPTTATAGSSAAPAPGTVMAIDERGALVACDGSLIRVVRAQLEGKKALHTADLARGRVLAANMRFASE